MDGIPGWVLDRALRAGLPKQLTRVHALGSKVGEERQQEFADKLASMEELQQVLAEPGRRLLALSVAGKRTKAAVSAGNVDTALHIGVYPPGMGSTVRGCLERYDDEMDRLRQKAVALGRPPEEVAAVPPSATPPSPGRSCCSGSPTGSAVLGRTSSISSPSATRAGRPRRPARAFLSAGLSLIGN